MSRDETRSDEVREDQVDETEDQPPEDQPDLADEAGEGAEEGNGPTKASVFAADDDEVDEDAVVTDLATSGRDTALAAEDAENARKEGDERSQVSEHRQAQADRATGGGGQGVHDAFKGPSSASLNSSVYPVEEDMKEHRGITEDPNESDADTSDSEDDEE